MYLNEDLDRRSELRQDKLEIERLFKSESSKTIISYKGKFLCETNRPLYLTSAELFNIGSKFGCILVEEFSSNEAIYLGELDKKHYFLLQLTEFPQDDDGLELLDLRSLSLEVNQFDLQTLLYSQGIINWHFNHQFCSKCGTKSRSTQSGHSRTCVNENCQKEHFPKIEPAVIFSLETTIEGVQKLLLARQPNWPDKRYSVLAGFAEHGESLELAVKREAFEEVGLLVDKISYISSQPWPFPASLMLGFSCETNQQNIRLIDDELEHADWFSAQEIKTAIETGELLLPFSVSISWYLIDRWYQSQTGQDLLTIKTPQ